MSVKEDIIMSWSGGKDSAFALHTILEENNYRVKYLLTNIYKPNKRVSMHGVPEELIESQAECIGIPLIKLYIEEKTHGEYEGKMKTLLLKLKQEGINKVAFGDIFLEDLKQYREDRLAEVDMQALFPLWNRKTSILAKDFMRKGFKTHICSIDLSKLPKELVGIQYSDDFLTELPTDVDPCGENGEFHSFCFDGPIFSKPVKFMSQGIVKKEYMHNNTIFYYLFSDLQPT